MKALNIDELKKEVYREALADFRKWAKKIGHYHAVAHVESFAKFKGIGSLGEKG